MDSGSAEIAFDCSSFRLFKDGQVERRAHRMVTVPAGFDADTGVTSKEVVIDVATGATARLYLPPMQQADSTKLPILVFFHGGHFIVGSAGEPIDHRYVNTLVARARAVAVSVEYRLAPEHPLPAAYDDAWAALKWSVSGADPWLSSHGDPGRVFLVGISAGANIVHNMAVSVGISGGLRAARPEPPRIEGVVLLHPSFSGKGKMETEEEEFWRANNSRWAIIFPGAKDGVDDPRINPMAAGAPSLTKLAGERLLVDTASEDPRAPRAQAYADAVRDSGWRGKVEWFESAGEGHAFFILNPGSRKADEVMDRVVDFLAGR